MRIRLRPHRIRSLQLDVYFGGQVSPPSRVLASSIYGFRMVELSILPCLIYGLGFALLYEFEASRL